ncbi:hypothetical protein [Streptomyces sp. NPDC002057]|uniref:hypothetical protein n=1 Tax=Streptomyces sp. NPDC002057 TaxID=3154664 RepID=UPI003327AC61
MTPRPSEASSARRNTSVPTKRPPLSPAQITAIECPSCGCRIHGVNSRYACTRCNWLSRWEDGDTELPNEADDPWPRKK